MAQETNYDGLSQVDSSIRKYFSKYMAPTLIKEQKLIAKKQQEEYYKNKTSTSLNVANQGVGGNVFSQMAMDEAKAVKFGTWSKLNTNDLIDRANKIWNKDTKLQKDLETLRNAFYFELVKAKNGGKPSQKLLEFANSYVEDRLNDLMLEQLARLKLPKSSMTYIAQHAFDGSILGVGSNLMVKGFSNPSGGVDEKINRKVEQLYKPKTWEKAAGVGGSLVWDTMSGGVGIGGSVIKFGAKKVGMSAAKAAVVGKGGAVAVDGAFHATEYSKGDGNLQEASSKALGDKDAVKKIRDGGKKYQHRYGEVQQRLNASLGKKVNLGSPNLAASQLNGRNNLLAKVKGDSTKMFMDVKSGLNRQAIPFNANAKAPGWMLKLSEKENRRMGAYYYSTAMEMSRSRRETITIGGKKMTLKEVAQRAFDYSNVASLQGSARERKYIEQRQRQLEAEARERRAAEVREEIERRASEEASAGDGNNAGQQAQQAAASGQVPSNANPDSMDGWGKTLDALGLDGLAGTSKNLGYCLAMLPDMIMGMFTGKNPNLRMEDHLLPLTAIMGSFFVKHNPLLKLILLGYGGANLFSAAGNAALAQKNGQATSEQGKAYKTYPDMQLNDRINEPVVKGNTLLANIDGVPIAMKLNQTVIDAYQKGHIPLNTLANSALQKYDEQRSMAALQYEQGVSARQDADRQVRQIK